MGVFNQTMRQFDEFLSLVVAMDLDTPTISYDLQILWQCDFY
jgi:hypothetical protein